MFKNARDYCIKETIASLRERERKRERERERLID